MRAAAERTAILELRVVQCMGYKQTIPTTDRKCGKPEPAQGKSRVHVAVAVAVAVTAGAATASHRAAKLLGQPTHPVQSSTDQHRSRPAQPADREKHSLRVVHQGAQVGHAAASAASSAHHLLDHRVLHHPLETAVLHHLLGPDNANEGQDQGGQPWPTPPVASKGQERTCS